MLCCAEKRSHFLSFQLLCHAVTTKADVTTDVFTAELGLDWGK